MKERIGKKKKTQKQKKKKKKKNNKLVSNKIKANESPVSLL